MIFSPLRFPVSQQIFRRPPTVTVTVTTSIIFGVEKLTVLSVAPVPPLNITFGVEKITVS